MRLYKKYLKEAEEFYKKGDRWRAGEKYYRAVCVLVKMIGAKLGMRHYTPKDRRKIIKELDRRYSKEEYVLEVLYEIAENLHRNFYRDFLSKKDFDDDVNFIIGKRGLIPRLEKILKTLEEEKSF